MTDPFETIHNKVVSEATPNLLGWSPIKMFQNLGLGPILMQAMADFIASGGTITEAWVFGEIEKELQTIETAHPNDWEGAAAKLLLAMVAIPFIQNLLWGYLQNLIPTA